MSTIFLVGPYEVALPLLVKQRFGERVGFYALLMSLSSHGSIIAAFWLGHFKRLRHRGLLTYGAWLVASLMLKVVGLPLSVDGVSLAIFIQGASLVVLGLAWTNTLQEFVPSGLLPIGYGLAGIAADRLGASLVFVIGGAISAGVIVLGMLHPAIRSVD